MDVVRKSLKGAPTCNSIVADFADHPASLTLEWPYR
jgi:hypothetical protein